MRRCLVPLPLLLVLAGAACTQAPTPPDEDVVGVTIAGPAGDRWAERDRAAFTAALDAACPGCRLQALDSGGPLPTVVREAVRRGADVLVVGGDDGAADDGVAAVEAAGSVPVVSYDAALPGAEHAVLLDHAAAGRDAARALRALADAERPRVLVLDGAGSPAALDATLEALDDGARVVGRLPADGGSAAAWLPGRAGRADVVLAGDEEATTAAVGALQSLPSARRPLLAGFGGGLTAVRRLVRGRQALLVHEPREQQAETAAEVAAGLVAGTPPASSGRVDGVPASVLSSTVVTAPTLTGTLVRQGTYSTEEICSGRVLRRCEALGIR